MICMHQLHAPSAGNGMCCVETGVNKGGGWDGVVGTGRYHVGPECVFQRVLAVTDRPGCVCSILNTCGAVLFTM